ncbi:uncharacterized protein PG986_014568 [Apiospora aurea]|uniref:Uncharacterized protein n=1 Tax=Apiospora aurea TaxID=335848 RepID=A0ABR1PTC2_9PEZI
MRADEKYADEMKAWRKDLDDAFAKVKEEAHQRWLKSDPETQASEDLDKFLAHYFMNDQGEPDPAKTIEPLALYTECELSCKLYEKAQHVPGLETASGGEGDWKALCIGWDRDAVRALAYEVDAKSRDELEDAKVEDWRQWMQTYNTHAYWAADPDNTNVIPKSRQPAQLQACKGHYKVRCEALEKVWSSQEIFTLDVADGPDPSTTGPSITLGRLEMTFFEGTMLSLNEQDMDTYIDGASDKEDSSIDTDESEGTDEETDEEEVEVTKDTAVSGSKRKAAPASATRSRSAKKERKEPKHARRVYLRLRDCELHEGQIWPTPGKGHLDFTDDTYTRFNGVVLLPFLYTTVTFQGYRMYETVVKDPEPWESFSRANAADKEGNYERWGDNRRK